MLLKSYSFSPDKSDYRFYYLVQAELEKYKFYFIKYAGINYAEAMQKTFMHVLTHFDSSKGSLSDYIKKLARVISKDSGKVIAVDFMDTTVAESDENGLGNVAGVIVKTGHTENFVDELVEQLDSERGYSKEMSELILSFPKHFLDLCNALLASEIQSAYYPEHFMQTCISLSKFIPNFNALCLEYFENYKDSINSFLELKDRVDAKWKEADYGSIRGSYSKRIKFINKNTKKLVEDADREYFYLSNTNLGGKQIYQVSYVNIWNYLCDLIDADDSNDVKLYIDDNFIVQTYGGSISVVNPILFNIYELIKMEILTNVLIETQGRILNIGSSNFYILCDKNNIKEVSHNFNTYRFSFHYVDITNKLLEV